MDYNSNKREDRRVMLEADSVLKQFHQYDAVVTAVNRATFRVFENEFVAIIGTSGSGKSTLLHICAGLERANGGKIKIRNHDITAMKPDELSRFRGQNIGVVFQNHNLIPQFTALENILVPALMCDRSEYQYEERLKKIIDALDIGDRLNHLPSELSGGQQQRVSIARALVKRPMLLFADEPTGNLDRANADEVLNLLLKTKAMLGQTLVMVTHDMSIAERADRIFIMENGELRVYR